MSVRRPRIQFVSLLEAAELLRVAPATLYAEARRPKEQRRLPWRQVGNRWFVNRLALERYFDSPVPAEVVEEIADYRQSKRDEARKRRKGAPKGPKRAPRSLNRSGASATG